MGDTQSRRIEERLAREFGLFGLLTLMALLQTTLLGTPLGFAVPLVQVLVFCRTLLGLGSAFPDVGVARAMRWAFYGGLALDLFASTFFGSHVLALLLASTLIVAGVRRLHVERPIIPLVAIAGGTLVYEAVLGLILQIGGLPIDWARYALVALVPAVLVALIPALPIFFGMRWLLREQL